MLLINGIFLIVLGMVAGGLMTAWVVVVYGMKEKPTLSHKVNFTSCLLLLFGLMYVMLNLLMLYDR